MSTRQPSQARKRIEFIDLLRGSAVIVMIETHVMNGTLAPGITESAFFQVLKFINGLVAPSFLFASGLAYAVTTRRKLNDYLSFGPPLFKQLGRLAFILLVGYSLHIPKFNYTHLRNLAGERAWQVFFQVDILQCIAVSLIILQLMLLVLRSERRLYGALMFVAAAVVLASPILWGIDFWTMLPVPIASYLNGLHYSLFPLFPWSAFLFAGAVAGYYYVEAREVDRREEGVAGTVTGRQYGGGSRQGALFVRVLWIALGMLAISFVIEPLAARVYPFYDYWRFSPSFVLLRLGLVLLLCAGMYFYEHSRGVSPGSAVALVGRESLLVYTVHLLLIYGNFGTFNFHDKVDNTFGYPQAMLTILVLWVLMYYLARAWSAAKHQPAFKRAIQSAVIVTLLGIFFFGPAV